MEFNEHYEIEVVGETNDAYYYYYSHEPGDIIDRYNKVRDHCHLSRKYRGTAHNICNVNLTLPQNIHVFCHNMRAYGAHVPIQELAIKNGKLWFIANVDEK